MALDRMASAGLNVGRTDAVPTETTRRILRPNPPVQPVGRNERRHQHQEERVVVRRQAAVLARTISASGRWRLPVKDSSDGVSQNTERGLFMTIQALPVSMRLRTMLRPVRISGLSSVLAPMTLVSSFIRRRRIEFNLPPLQPEKRLLENLRRELFVKSADLGDAAPGAQGGGDGRAGGCAADHVEPMAKVDGSAYDFLDQRFDPLEECDGGCAAHAAAVKRQDPLGARAK